jgi:ABC-type uncharacterized transport system permease subunit
MFPALALFASVAYMLGTAAALTPATRPERLQWVPGLGVAALAAHLTALYVHGRSHGIDLSFFNALSAIAALCVAVLLTLMLWRRLQRLAAVVFPIAVLSLLLAALLETRPSAHGIADWRIATHAALAVLAFATLAIAAVVAIQLGVQDHALRAHRLSRWFSGAPPLVQVEQLLFQLIAAGFLLLTVALLTGVLFVNDLMGQHLAHKTVLSAVAWAVFGVLLAGRMRYGWRGRRAVRLVLSGVALLVLAYFGSKFVLDVVLQRGG